ncbi:GNAT family N-acetyltransferase [Halarcobacter ebronensis]|uniref:GNAT family N-acetyltransferase n=1 Tax=Halarcobacter ebronensis TaxID=1462615 RepID=A0A4Q0YES0_9BACT|nr:lysophospholipid acyltransferase family protein [Halarcobacter ebronensis]RXJ68972.1 GNAT family N-acetyltransferase [Halarcobacter ebronensis]
MIDVQKEIEKKFPKVAKKPNFLSKSLIKIAKKVIHENSINEFLEKNSHLKGLEFIDAVLDYFEFDYTVSSNDLQNIPSSGKVVIIANHPLGALDALSLLKLVSTVRKDVKIVANDFLVGIDALSSLLIPIDNYKMRQSKKDIQKVYEALNNEQAVIIFPAGEVSRASANGVKDPSWNKGFLNFAMNSNSPILPIFIGGKNSKTFYTMSLINKTFSTLLLSNEMFKKQSKNINIKIGEIIPNENIKPRGLDKKVIVNLYKRHIYALKKGKKSFFLTQKAIAHPQKKDEILKELKKSQLLGETLDGKKIYLYDYETDSVVLRELGRLRELSFRRVGEGINAKSDTDKYDIYYQHIILWDENDLEIVGSYRIGNGNLILEKKGLKGFYSNTLFKYDTKFEPYLKDSIELGRSFVQPKYWGTRALDYLWYGIGAYLKAHKEIKYMFGPVSISGTFPSFAKDMMIFYYSHYFANDEEIVEAKLPYQYSSHIMDLKNVFQLDDRKKDFKVLKSTLSDMGVAVPTLFKQYSDVCEDGGVKFLAFNVDPDFSNCIDGMILVDVSTLKASARKRYIGE